jgi:hypothetical protein
MARHSKTDAVIEKAAEILDTHHPMSLRQVFYRLVSVQIIANSEGAYRALMRTLVIARQEGSIPWEWIEDRLRRPLRPNMWRGLGAFAEDAARWYRRDVWETQPRYVEVWLEKDALSGIFERVLEPYGATLNVGRGFDGWDSIHNAAQRYGDDTVILYFGDFDPSGEDMVRSLGLRLMQQGAEPEIIKIALTRAQIDLYELPPNPAKASDPRSPAFVARHGDVAVELDALPLGVLEKLITSEVEARMDLTSLRAVQELGQQEREELIAALSSIRGR